MAASDAGLRIRVERKLRERFLAFCREWQTPAAHILRAFMRKYVATHDTADAGPSHEQSQKKPAARVPG
jgi:TfoX/Sxy family transcriptional regulator of competence genes